MKDLLTSDDPAISPGYVLSLIEWLPDDGAFAASLRGGREHYGKGLMWHLLADQWDLSAAAATAGSKKRPPQYPRPGAKKKTVGIPLMALAPRRVAPGPRESG